MNGLPEPELLHEASEEAEKAIYEALRGYNVGRFGPSGYRKLQIVLKDNAGAVIGGLSGETSRGWLFIRLLFVPEEWRGQGIATRLLEMAEAEARQRGCTGIQIDTMSPEALRLYRRFGFAIAGEVPDLTGGLTLTWLTKRLQA